MPDTPHQKNLALYILSILLVCFAVFQVYVSENSVPQHSRVEVIKEQSEQSKDVELFMATGANTESVVPYFEQLEVLSGRILFLEQLNFDKIGPTDYAARIFGGQVVSAVATSRHRNSILSRMQNMISSIYGNDYRMQCIIQNCGTCYALEGRSGTIVLMLAKDVYMKAITIEHIPKSSLPTKMEPYSAIKEFSVWGTNNPRDTGKEIYFGTFSFEYKATFLETFELDLHHEMPSVRFVRIDIHSNHGENFTCIYRIRVHGTPEE